MSILDQRRLIESIHPFELLSSVELDNLMSKIDIAYYTKETLLVSPRLESIAFYIIIKGQVSEYVDNELYNIYNEGDSFDADALIYQETSSRFVVTEDLICYEIKKDDFLDLMQNKKIQGYFLQDFISRHKQLKEYHNSSELTPFLVARVSDIYLHEACIVSSQTSIYDALQKQKRFKASIIIVDEKECVVTDTDLKEKVLLGNVQIDEPIETIATSKMVSVEKEEFLFNALLVMTHEEIKRVVVQDGGKIIGVLEQLDLLSFFANHSHLVAVQIDRANSIEDLQGIQDDVKNLILALTAKGVKVRYITKLVSALNEKIYKKAFEMCVDESLQNKCSLIVMGSEGREEQGVKSDQDNALIVDDSVDVALFEKPMMQINSFLLDIGFPECKGGVMVSNPFWRRNVRSYQELIDGWSSSMDESTLQNLSIFLDAKCVSGNCDLLDGLKDFLFQRFEARDDVLAHLAKATLNFETPLSVFSNFVVEKSHANKLDVKKGGLFALVHGIRCLALKYRIEQTNTVERIKQLNNKGVIDKNFASELIESFDTLSSMKLKTMLGATSLDDDNFIDPNSLEKVQKDLLKDSFKIVNKFKKFITFHFHLEIVS
ncbi:putative nucleotidyltransferase substrate binding domain-containing protein [Sulfurimonas sp. C5]|uniref:putative nucleotidyltransferase substrate binding domain-containing protein n=1 Tax=Sulfurimonas sp. C5 TaxID=3036947 RepID=UPI0024588B35|nr:putative nucleotidyltransferase substrate binding domain-containing protein [Sulfurimonas sp. C5]MDH4943515.1 putative nucleotidyltransferase substrate binding domain-containing protein [Sulfurimonas sp. C5]